MKRENSSSLIEKVVSIQKNSGWTAVLFAHSKLRVARSENPLEDAAFRETVQEAARCRLLIGVYTRECPEHWIRSDLEWSLKSV